MRETRTFQPGTLGETPSSVSIRLNTIQGCRPISVNTQPTRLPSRGSGAAQMAMRHIHRAGGFGAFLRVNQRPATAMRVAAPPMLDASTSASKRTIP